jgi:UDP-glucose 4-epimerase
LGRQVIAHAEALEHEVWRFDRADGNDILGDLSGLGDAQHVIHLAGMLGTSELFDAAEEAVETNVIGTLRVLEWCQKAGATFTGITMPDSSWANVYQATKLCSMRLATAWHRNRGVAVSHVRAFNAYGQGQKHGPGHPQKFLPTFATMAWAGQPLPIWGNGLQTLDPVRAADVGRMLVDAIDYGDDQVFDAGTGVGVTVKTIARFVNRACGQDEDNMEFLPMRDGEEWESDIHAKGEGWDVLGWQPQLNWEAMQRAVEWYRPE